MNCKKISIYFIILFLSALTLLLMTMNINEYKKRDEYIAEALSSKLIKYKRLVEYYCANVEAFNNTGGRFGHKSYDRLENFYICEEAPWGLK